LVSEIQGQSVKKRRKIFRSSFRFSSLCIPREVKRSEKTFISFHLEAKQSEKKTLFLFRFEAKQKIGGETKRNKKLLEAKQSKKTLFYFPLIRS
jgi:hypothetical protein